MREALKLVALLLGLSLIAWPTLFWLNHWSIAQAVWMLPGVFVAITLATCLGAWGRWRFVALLLLLALPVAVGLGMAAWGIQAHYRSIVIRTHPKPDQAGMNLSATPLLQ